jgi:hypothetical protein
MKNQWKSIKLGMMLFALPLVATAAASAHQWMSETSPISISVQSAATEDAISSNRVHTVAMNSNGVIEGRLAAINADTNQTQGLADLKVYFVKDGEVVKETTTVEDGTFAIGDIAEGAYSFIATGKNGFAAYGVQVITDTTGKFDNTMEAAAVSPKFATVKNILTEKLPKQVADEISSSETVATKVVGSNRIRLNNGSLEGHVFPIVGKVSSVKGTYVHILRDDKQVAEVQADETGSFMVSDLEPGIYDFVAAGPSGFAAVSFEAVQDAESVIDTEIPAGSVEDLVDSEEVPVSIDPVAAVEPGMIMADPIAYQDAIPADIPFDGGYSDSLDVCMTCQGDNMIVGEQLSYAGVEAPISYDQGIVDYGMPIEYAGESIGCGCASGGSCGAASNFSSYSACNTGCNTAGGGLLRGGLGGGRLGGGLRGGLGGGLLGGGSGIGRLALLGGLAVGIVSIADDSNPNDGTETGGG